MKKRLFGILLGLGLALGLLAAPVASTPISQPTAVAQAGDCSLGGTWCGRIHQRMGSGTSLLVTYAWNCGTSCPTRILYNGQNSESYGKDADGFYVSPNVCVRLKAWSQGDGTWWSSEKVYGGSSGLWKKVGDRPPGDYWQVEYPC